MPKNKAQPQIELRPVALITGGAKRLGAELCAAFFNAGWRIACHVNTSQNDAEKLLQSLSASEDLFKIYSYDLADSKQAENLVEQVLVGFGRLDCIINNASLFEPDFGDNFTPAAYVLHHQVNVLAPLLLSQSLFLHAKNRNKTSAVVHILDQKVDNLNPDYFSYTMSKLSLKEAIKLQAQSYAPHLRVLGLSPGLMYLSGPQTQANFDKASKINLLKSAIDPAMVAKACLDLVENPILNGAILNADCGQHLVPLGRDVMFLIEDV